MSQYRYQVIPFIGQLKSGVFTTANAQTVSSQLSSLIDTQVQQGWEFYSIEKVGIEVAPGCLAGILGAKTAYINFDQVIFRRPA